MRWRKRQVYNVIHKTSVSVLMGASAVLMAYTTYLFGYFWIVRRPALKAELRRYKEEEIAAEQKAHDTDHNSSEVLQQ